MIVAATIHVAPFETRLRRSCCRPRPRSRHSGPLALFPSISASVSSTLGGNRKSPKVIFFHPCPFPISCGILWAFMVFQIYTDSKKRFIISMKSVEQWTSFVYNGYIYIISATYRVTLKMGRWSEAFQVSNIREFWRCLAGRARCAGREFIV